MDIINKIWSINFIHSYYKSVIESGNLWAKILENLKTKIKHFSHYSIQFLRMTLSCTIIFKNKFQDLHEAQEKLSKLLPKSQTVIDTVISHYCLSWSIPTIELIHDFAPLFLHQFILIPDHIVLSIS